MEIAASIDYGIGDQALIERSQLSLMLTVFGNRTRGPGLRSLRRKPLECAVDGERRSHDQPPSFRITRHTADTTLSGPPAVGTVADVLIQENLFLAGNVT